MAWHIICLTLLSCTSFQVQAKELKSTLIQITTSKEKTGSKDSFTISKGQALQKHVDLKVELALTSSEQEQGLMFRKSLAPGRGMLFVFSKEEPRYFWMKNTLIPLSVAFIDGKHTIFKISKLNPVKTLVQKTYDKAESIQPAKYVLEVPQGWFKKNSITVGSKIIWPDERKILQKSKLN